jgi:dTDP-4-amino-4,6-dideoxygalactose transaminase
MFIPFHRPTIGEDEIREVERVLRSGWLTTGPRTAQFEREFCEYTRAEHALATNSGTAAMHLALAALGIGAGDEVITTPLTFCSTVNTIFQVGATPVLADVGLDGNIDPDAVECRITARTRAILPVHLAGRPCDLERIWALAERHGLAVLEDAAHAVGSQYGSSYVGSGRSDAVAFSFYATKNLTTGEGGMVTSSNPRLMDEMKILCLHGISKDAWNRYGKNGHWFYEVTACGFKYNMTDIQAAIGIHQLKKQELFVDVRTRYAGIYKEMLGDLPELTLPDGCPGDGRHAWHLYLLQLNLEQLTIDRDDFIEQLRGLNIAASVHFIPIFLHSYFKPYADLPHNQCPRALDMYRRLVSLPLYPAMTVDEVGYVAKAVQAIVKRARVTKRVSVVAGV